MPAPGLGLDLFHGAREVDVDDLKGSSRADGRAVSRSFGCGAFDRSIVMIHGVDRVNLALAGFSAADRI